MSANELAQLAGLLPQVKPVDQALLKDADIDYSKIPQETDLKDYDTLHRPRASLSRCQLQNISQKAITPMSKILHDSLCLCGNVPFRYYKSTVVEIEEVTDYVYVPRKWDWVEWTDRRGRYHCQRRLVPNLQNIIYRDPSTGLSVNPFQVIEESECMVGKRVIATDKHDKEILDENGAYIFVRNNSFDDRTVTTQLTRKDYAVDCHNTEHYYIADHYQTVHKHTEHPTLNERPVDIYAMSNGDSVLRAYTPGVFHCGSSWSCPVCTPIILENRGKVIDSVIDSAYESGKEVIAVTFTVPTLFGMSLPDSFKIERKAYKRFIRRLQREFPEVYNTIYRYTYEQHCKNGTVRHFEPLAVVHAWETTLRIRYSKEFYRHRCKQVTSDGYAELYAYYMSLIDYHENYHKLTGEWHIFSFKHLMDLDEVIAFDEWYHCYWQLVYPEIQAIEQRFNERYAYIRKVGKKLKDGDTYAKVYDALTLREKAQMLAAVENLRYHPHRHSNFICEKYSLKVWRKHIYELRKLWADCVVKTAAKQGYDFSHKYDMLCHIGLEVSKSLVHSSAYLVDPDKVRRKYFVLACEDGSINKILDKLEHAQATGDDDTLEYLERRFGKFYEQNDAPFENTPKTSVSASRHINLECNSRKGTLDPFELLENLTLCHKLVWNDFICGTNRHERIRLSMGLTSEFAIEVPATKNIFDSPELTKTYVGTISFEDYRRLKDADCFELLNEYLNGSVEGVIERTVDFFDGHGIDYDYDESNAFRRRSSWDTTAAAG